MAHGLWATGRTGPWFTFNQIKKMGGHVRKGEKGSIVTFWKLIDDKQNPKKKIPLLRYYTVFSLDQADKINPAKLPAWYRNHLDPKPVEDKEPEPTFTPIEQAEQIWNTFRCKPALTEGQTAAWYKPFEDRIGLPAKESFVSVPEYYSTLFHEAVHSTGHKDRLDRGLSTFFGSHEYSKEELVAEIGSAFLCAAAGIECEKTLENSAAYIHNWRKKLTEDPKLIVQAASQAQRACDHILGVEFDREGVAE